MNIVRLRLALRIFLLLNHVKNMQTAPIISMLWAAFVVVMLCRIYDTQAVIFETNHRIYDIISSGYLYIARSVC